MRSSHTCSLAMAGANQRRLSQGDHRLIHPVTSTTPGEFAASPVRKIRRQSLPARLSPPRQIEFNGVVDKKSNTYRHISAVADGAKIGKEIPSSTLDHLTKGQKVFYIRLHKICDVVTTHPLPVRVTRITGRGEFFDRGDPIPKHATLTVEGVEEPLVGQLQFEELLSAALSERARRRNDQVKDGEPLGTVADGVEWALMQKVSSFNNNILPVGMSTVDNPGANASSSCPSRYQDDVATLVKVARVWAECLAWGLVSRGDWTYPGITTRLLKQTLRIPQVKIVVKMQVGKGGGVGEKEAYPSGNKSGKRTVSEIRRSAEGRRKQASLHAFNEKPSDRADEEEEVVLWSNHTRDLAANLAGVFKKEGAEEATRKAAAAIGRRIEVMARCYAILRVSLQDIIEGKASTCMLTGDNHAEVTESCLLWLKETTTRKVTADWAKRKGDVSQVISCIKLSIERELKVSDAVPVWLKKNVRAAEDNDETTAVPTEKEFSALKRKYEKMAQDTDTVAVMLHHAFFLVLPCQPFSFHFTWGRFMRFYHETGLNAYISKYYTEEFRTGRNWVNSDTGQSWIAPAVGRDGSATSGELTAGGTSGNTNDNMNASNETNPDRRGRGLGGRQGGHYFLPPVSRQVARNLVKPLHPATLALPSPSSNTSAAEGARGNAQLQQWNRSTESRNKGGEDGTSTLTSSEAAVANECLVSLLAVHGTTSRLATCAQVTAALKREGFPDTKTSLALLKDVRALKGRGVSDRLWRKRRGAALIRLRAKRSLFARLPSELFRNVLTFLA